MKWFLLALLFITGPIAMRIPGAEAFNPPRQYRAQYEEDVVCAEIANPRPFEGIHWFVVPGENFRDPSDANSAPLLGLWVSPDTIFIAGDWKATWVPKHEMIHYLMQRDHYAGDSAVFGSRCHAMWGYLQPDTTPPKPGLSTAGPADSLLPHWDNRHFGPGDFLP